MKSKLQNKKKIVKILTKINPSRAAVNATNKARMCNSQTAFGFELRLVKRIHISDFDQMSIIEFNNTITQTNITLKIVTNSLIFQVRCRPQVRFSIQLNPILIVNNAPVSSTPLPRIKKPGVIIIIIRIFSFKESTVSNIQLIEPNKTKIKSPIYEMQLSLHNKSQLKLKIIIQLSADFLRLMNSIL